MSKAIAFFALLSLLAAASNGCDKSAALQGTWKVDVEQSMAGITEVPAEMQNRCPTLDAYKAYLRPRLTGMTIVLQADGAAYIHEGNQRDAMKYTWREDEKYDAWLRTPAGFFSIGHGFKIQGDGTAKCLYQMDYSEARAPRSPIVLKKS